MCGTALPRVSPKQAELCGQQGDLGIVDLCHQDRWAMQLAGLNVVINNRGALDQGHARELCEHFHITLWLKHCNDRSIPWKLDIARWVTMREYVHRRKSSRGVHKSLTNDVPRANALRSLKQLGTLTAASPCALRAIPENI